jgi:hypothetical protein
MSQYNKILYFTAAGDPIIDSNPQTAEALRKFRTSFRWGKIALDYLVQAADAKASRPALSDPVSAWMKPIAAKRLAEDGIRTLTDLMGTIRLRGKGWYRPIPCPLAPARRDALRRGCGLMQTRWGRSPLSCLTWTRTNPCKFWNGFPAPCPRSNRSVPPMNWMVPKG